LKRRRWNYDFPIPASVALPGCRVRVALADPNASSIAANTHGLWLYDVDEDKAAIVISKDAPIEVQRYVLLHELLHAIHEILDVGISEFPELVRPTVKK